MTNYHRQEAVWVSSGDPETSVDGVLRDPGQLGQYVTVKQPSANPPGVELGRDKTYRYVGTDSSMTVAPFKGAVAFWQDKSQFKTTTAATNRNARAGVYQNPAGTAWPPGHWGFIQTGGPAVVKFVDAPTATPNVAGRVVIPSATAGKADCLAVGTAPTHVTLGQVGLTPQWDAAAVEAIVELEIPDTP